MSDIDRSYAGLFYTGDGKCPICGKVFSYTGNWVYKMHKRGGYVLFCSWTCMRRAEKEGLKRPASSASRVTRWRDRPDDWLEKLLEERKKGMSYNQAVSEMHTGRITIQMIEEEEKMAKGEKFQPTEEQIARIRKIRAAGGGYNQVAKLLGVAHMTARRIVLELEGQEAPETGEEQEDEPEDHVTVDAEKIAFKPDKAGEAIPAELPEDFTFSQITGKCATYTINQITGLIRVESLVCGAIEMSAEAWRDLLEEIPKALRILCA